jgi:hypothetical protein
VQRFRFGDGEVLLLSTVQGLVSERDRVLAALHTERPDVLALGQSAESVADLLRFEPSAEVDPYEDLMDHDLVYAAQLEAFGEVQLPPPDLLAAVRWARDKGVTCFGVDLAEEAYAMLFTKSVSTWGFLRYGRIQRRLSRRPPRAPDARALSLAWDARFRKVKGIRIVEAAREAHMAQHAAHLARETPAKVLLLVDAPREAGTAQLLATLD